VHALAWDAFGDEIVHIEFKRVRRDVKTEIEVELEFRGHPKGGMLNHLVTHVTVLCLPMDIPDMIEVPVGHLDVGGAVLAKELVLPKGVELVKPTGDYKVAVAVLAKVEVLTPAAEAPTEGGTVAAASAATPAAGAPGAAGAPAAGGKAAAAPAKEEKPKKG
jgi:large subunit ribosomal protein L25